MAWLTFFMLLGETFSKCLQETFDTQFPYPEYQSMGQYPFILGHLIPFDELDCFVHIWEKLIHVSCHVLRWAETMKE